MIHRFGEYELDDARRELRRAGVPVETEPKAFELLLFLIRHRDRAVSKDELQNELWPRSIVTETALTRCVMKARRAVGDDAANQRVIRTLQRHGYRFIADMHPEEAAANGAGDAAQTGSEHGKPAWRALIAGIAAVILLAVTGLAGLRWLQGPVATGTLAVLPVMNEVDDEGYTWVRLGMMSLLNRMLEDQGVDVAGEQSVLRALDDEELPAATDGELLERLHRQLDAGVVLRTTLDQQGGLYRLAATLTYTDGTRARRVIVGDTPAVLAADMATVIGGLVSNGNAPQPGRFSKAAIDPFVNEMYGRALDLELQGRIDAARDMFRVAADLEPGLFWLRYEIAVCTRDLREWDDAVAQFDALLTEARDGNDASAQIATLNALGIMGLNRNELDTAERHFNDALAVATERQLADDRATLHINLALIENRRGDRASARRHYDHALQIYEANNEELPPEFANNYAGLLLNAGELAEAQKYSELAVAGFRLQGRRGYEAPSLNRLARILRRRGDIEGALARHEQSLHIYQEIGNEIGAISVISAMTSAFREKGDLTRARLNADEALLRAAGTDDSLLLATAYMQSAAVHADLGDQDSALSEYTAARKMLAATGDTDAMHHADRGIVLALLAKGDTGRATTTTNAMLEEATQSGDDARLARVHWLVAQVADATGDFDSAARHYQMVLDHARSHDDESLLIDAALALARHYLERGDLPAAGALLEEVRETGGRQHEFARLDARLAFAQGDRQRAHTIMATLRLRAGEAWRPDDAALLSRTVHE